MQMEQIWNQVVEVAAPYLPRLAAAAGVLIGGWLIALIIAAVIRALLKRTTIDDRIAEWIAGEEKIKAFDLEALIAKSIYYVLMLFVLVAFFQTLGLTIITEPLNGLLMQLFEFAPRILAGAALLGVAWLLATVVRLVIVRVMGATQIDEKLTSGAGLESGKKVSLAETLADALYWLIFLLFLPAILGALALDGLLSPIQTMMNEFLGYLPNIVAAGLTLAVGWFLARVVRRIITNLLAAVGLDSLGERVGLTTVLGNQKLSGLVGLVAYILILVPVLITALNALGIESLTRPASNMLNSILAALPALFGAALILVIAYVLARIVAGLVTNLLAGLGFDKILARLGLGQKTPEGDSAPSKVVGSLVLVAIMLFASIEAAGMLGFEALSVILVDILELAGHVALGLVIFAIGLFLANLAAGAIESTGSSQARLVATVARVAIVLLTGAMALRQMGLANDIINLAFGLIVGAAAVAVAIAFGIGGRDLAARQLDNWSRKAETKD